MPISVATVFHEEIEKHFRNHLPREAVNILQAMAGQAMQLEDMMNKQQEIIRKLMKMAVLSDDTRKSMQDAIDRIEKSNGLAMSERIKGDMN